MNISICITTFKEKKEDLEKLINSLKNQTLKPSEIIIIDAADYKNCSRAEGRNIAVKKAKNEIIAMTDVGCIADKNWLEKITKPIIQKKSQVSAGFYRMKARNNFQKATSVFLGIAPSGFSKKFLPSTRSVAFTKSVWKKVGGFDENLHGAVDDTAFNYKLVKNNINISRVKDAIVEWGMPETIFEFMKKIYNYAKGDAESKIWLFPGKGLTSHNIKVLFVFLRYFLGLTLLFYFNFYHVSFALYLLYILIFLYFLYSYKKAGLWGIILQLAADLGVMAGFVSGIMGL